jgi:hypothetical protein
MILVRCMLVVRAVRTTRRMCFTNSSSNECKYRSYSVGERQRYGRCVHIPFGYIEHKLAFGYFV